MSIFKKSKQKFVVSEREPTYRVRYLGNVQTALMKGDGCVDKPTSILWNNHVKSHNMGIGMKLTVCASGLKAHTKEQGLTEYRAHRISYCIAHPDYPRLFVWVYRHEGKKMKVELRCHAVLCKSEEKAKAMAVQLHDKLSLALSEFLREKTRRQNTRLTLQRTNSLPGSTSIVSGVPLRKKFLSMGANFKPPIDKSSSAPKLGDITEDMEPVEEVERIPKLHSLDEDISEQKEEAEFVVQDDILLDSSGKLLHSGRSLDSEARLTNGGLECPAVVGDHTTSYKTAASSMPDLTEAVFNLEIGNDVEALKRDERVQYQLTREDSGDDSSESGYSEQDSKEATPDGSANGESLNSVNSGLTTEGLGDQIEPLPDTFSNLPDASDAPDLVADVTLTASHPTWLPDSHENVNTKTPSSAILEASVH